jgi:hypothetical protein
MCPLCIATAALIATSATSTGGLTALVVKLRAKTAAEKMIPEPEIEESVSGPPTETAENAEKKRKG